MRRVVVSGVIIALACSSAGDGKDTPSRAAAGSKGGDSTSTAAVAPGSSSAPTPGSAGTGGIRPRVLILGTSLTAGLGLDPSEAYPAYLQYIADSLGVVVEIVNGGLSGETSAGALRRIDWLLNDSAAVVVIETGANDGLRGLDPDSTAANILAIVRKVKEKSPRAKVMIAQMEAPPNFGPAYTAKFSEIFPRAAKETGATLVPFLLDSVAGVGTLNQPDGIHPTAAGAKIVARNVWRTLGPEILRLDRLRQGG